MRKELPASRLMSGLAFFLAFRRRFSSGENSVASNHGKTMGKPWENGDLSKKTVDLMGFMANL